MGMIATLGKVGLLSSFGIGIMHELTGADSLKFASLLLGGTSLVILLNYARGKGKSLSNDVLHYLKFLKWPR